MPQSGETSKVFLSNEWLSDLKVLLYTLFSLYKIGKPKHDVKHGTIIRTGITCKEISLQKSIKIGMVLK